MLSDMPSSGAPAPAPARVRTNQTRLCACWGDQIVCCAVAAAMLVAWGALCVCPTAVQLSVRVWLRRRSRRRIRRKKPRPPRPRLRLRRRRPWRTRTATTTHCSNNAPIFLCQHYLLAFHHNHTAPSTLSLHQLVLDNYFLTHFNSPCLILLLLVHGEALLDARDLRVCQPCLGEKRLAIRTLAVSNPSLRIQTRQGVSVVVSLSSVAQRGSGSGRRLARAERERAVAGLGVRAHQRAW
eukprot:COSAG04_NODE_19_length_39217_cov_21.535968_1_plen_239_part_00